MSLFQILPNIFDYRHMLSLTGCFFCCYTVNFTSSFFCTTDILWNARHHSGLRTQVGKSPALCIIILTIFLHTLSCLNFIIPLWNRLGKRWYLDLVDVKMEAFTCYDKPANEWIIMVHLIHSFQMPNLSICCHMRQGHDHQESWRINIRNMIEIHTDTDILAPELKYTHSRWPTAWSPGLLSVA